MVPRETVSFVFPRTRGKTKLTNFLRDHTLSALLYILFLQSCAVVFGARATTAQLSSGRDTFEFDQGRMTKNQTITVLVLLSENQGI